MSKPNKERTSLPGPGEDSHRDDVPMWDAAATIPDDLLDGAFFAMCEERGVDPLDFLEGE